MSRRDVRQTRRAASGQAFSPSGLSGLFLWLRSDLGITLNSGKVSSWADQSGNGNTVTQGTAANQPPYTSSGGGGNKPFLQYTGQSAMALDNNAVTLAQPFEAFITIHQDAALGGAGTTYLLDIGAGGSTGAIVQVSQSTQINFGGGGSSLSVSLSVADHIIDAQWNGASSSIGIDGGAPVVASASHAETISQIHVGQAGGQATFGANANFYEIILYSRILSAGDRLSVSRYLGNRYAISVP